MPRIAIVEKDALVALDIEKTLLRAGYDCSARFSTGSEYLAFLQSESCTLAIIGTDIGGELSGVETAYCAKSRHGIPNILITLFLNENFSDENKRAEPLGILVKPFSERELLSTVEVALFRASMENRLSKSELRYRELFSMSITARCISTMAGELVEFNASFKKVFLEKTASPFNISSLFINPGDWKDIIAQISDGKSIEGKEFPILHPDGFQLTMIASFSFILDAHHEIPMISAEFFDLTESKNLREELYQAQKMEALGRLAGGIAHDFNNILTAIIGHAEMLRMDIPPASPSAEDVDGIYRTAERASRLTKQLLGFSRKKAYSPKPLDVCNLAREAESLLRKLAGESIMLSSIIPNHPIFILADYTQIEQCLINLIVNARDALEGKAAPRIMIRVEEKILIEPIDLRSIRLESGSYAIIEVSDNGKGIPEKAFAKIFEPFYTTKEMGKGTGLGLSIVLSVMKQLGGAVEVVSKENAGTSFTLWFPAHGKLEGLHSDSAGSEAIITSSLKTSWSKDRKIKILVVDDDEYLLGFLSYALEKLGIEVIPARNAGEAIIASERHSFSALILDLLLPGMSGLELYQRLCKNTRLPCVLITGAMESAMKVPAGAELLEKPFSVTDLIARLNSVLSR